MKSREKRRTSSSASFSSLSSSESSWASSSRISSSWGWRSWARSWAENLGIGWSSLVGVEILGLGV